MKSLGPTPLKPDESLFTYLQTLLKLQKSFTKSSEKLKNSQKDLNFQLNLEPSIPDSIHSILSTHSSELEKVILKWTSRLSLLEDLIKCLQSSKFNLDSRRSSYETNSFYNTLSIDNLEKIEILQQDLQNNEDINELVKKLKDSRIITQDQSSVHCLTKAVELLINIKNVLKDEDLVLNDEQDLPARISRIFQKCKTMILGLEKEIVTKQKQIFEISRIEKGEEVSRVYKDLNAFDTSKIIKAAQDKLLKKKNKIALHKEQIVVLKDSVRELQGQLENIKELDVFHLRELWWTIVRKIPILDKEIEENVQVFTRMLGFSRKDIIIMNDERSEKKVKRKFSLFRN
jgi:hypothetical protein